MGGLVQVLQKGHRGLSEADPARGERGQLVQAQADVVAARVVAFQGAPAGEGGHQPVGGGEGEPGAVADPGEGEAGVPVVEGAEDGEQPLRGGGAGRHGGSAPVGGVGHPLQQRVQGLPFPRAERLQQVVGDAAARRVGLAQYVTAPVGQDDDAAAPVPGDGRRSARPRPWRSSTRLTMALGS